MYVWIPAFAGMTEEADCLVANTPCNNEKKEERKNDGKKYAVKINTITFS
jgi:hypothetical protein